MMEERIDTVLECVESAVLIIEIEHRIYTVCGIRDEY